MPNTPFPQAESEAQIIQRIAVRRRRNNWLAVILLVTPIVWTIPTFFYMRAHTNSVNEQCQSQLRALGGALLNYSQQHQGRLPNAKNWISPLPVKTDSLECPSDIDQAHTSSYAMNANLSDKKLTEIKDPSHTILLYETTSKAAVPFGRGEDLMRVGKDNVGVGRHNTIAYRFNYYLMADGTVKYPANIEEVKNYKWTP